MSDCDGWSRFFAGITLVTVSSKGLTGYFSHVVLAGASGELTAEAVLPFTQTFEEVNTTDRFRQPNKGRMGSWMGHQTRSIQERKMPLPQLCRNVGRVMTS